jgi:hypothetical protein
MSVRKKESYVSYVESNSRSIPSGSPIEEFMTLVCSSKFVFGSPTDSGAPEY